MRPLPLAQIARWVEGRHLGADVTVTAVATDSRTLVPGSLFVALRGEHHDAHDHITQACERGAAALLVQREVHSPLPQVRQTLFSSRPFSVPHARHAQTTSRITAY